MAYHRRSLQTIDHPLRVSSFNSLSENGILHITSAPYHPLSNRLAERAVQSFKQGLKRTLGFSIQTHLSKFLFQYRITPHTTTGVPPAELLMGRCRHSRMDLSTLIYLRRYRKKFQQKLCHDNMHLSNTFTVADRIYTKKFSQTS